MRDVLALQDEVARSSLTRSRFDRQVRGRKRRPRLSLPGGPRGVPLRTLLLEQVDADGFQKAGDYFQRALAIDAVYPAAHAGLADADALLGYYGVVAPRDAFRKRRLRRSTRWRWTKR